MLRTMLIVTLVMYCANSSISFVRNAYAETAAFSYNNPQIQVRWQVVKISQTRVQVTGQLKNVDSEEKNAAELQVRSLNRGGDATGEARFKFAPKLVANSEVPFGMMLDVANYDSIEMIELSLHYSQVLFGDTIVQQFHRFTGSLQKNADDAN